LLLATGNAGKLAELRDLLADIPAILVSPREVGVEITVEEDGRTYVDNAVKKAVAYARASGLVCLADDSGLEVEALDGAPGLRSKRYLAIEGASDADRRAFLLENLAGRPQPWRALFRAAIAIADPEGSARWTEGTCGGEIVPTERGSGGFGYDPVFRVERTGLTMAELDLAHKNRISHRARAIALALPALHKLFDEDQPAAALVQH